MYHNFLSPEECEHIMQEAKPMVRSRLFHIVMSLTLIANWHRYGRLHVYYSSTALNGTHGAWPLKLRCPTRGKKRSSRLMHEGLQPIHYAA